MYYVYILGSDSKHYIGVTDDLERRLLEHQRGQTKTTSSYKNLYLRGYFIKNTRSEAMKLETIIKKNGHIHYRIQHETFIHADVA